MTYIDKENIGSQMTIILKKEQHVENCFDDSSETSKDIKPPFLPFED